MNLLALTDRELIEYLDKYNDDPVIQRLVKMTIYTSHTSDEIENLIEDLGRAGMDDYLTIDDESPGRYIRNLEMEYREASAALEDVKEQLDELKTRTVVDFIADVKYQVKSLESENRRMEMNLKETQNELKRVSEQRDMWAVMNRKDTYNA